MSVDRAQRSYEGVALLAPVSFAYARQSSRGAAWFIGRCLELMLKAVGLEKDAVDGFAAALERATQTERIREFYEKKLFADRFLKGAPLQESLDATWERILPVAQQAKKK